MIEYKHQKLNKRLLSLVFLPCFFALSGISTGDKYVSYIVDPAKQDIRLYYQNEKKENFLSIQNLVDWLKSRRQELVFAMNAGMYQEDHSPLGLYIENGKRIRRLNTRSGKGNFYLNPNGVFYITSSKEARIVKTEEFVLSKEIRYATQSGPMLLIDGLINPKFSKTSKNVNIRNGVGILTNNKLVFAMSKEEVNFYEFAEYFKSQGCTNALYLDGFVSQTYLPEKKWAQTGGEFGVIIGVTKKIK